MARRPSALDLILCSKIHSSSGRGATFRSTERRPPSGTYQPDSGLFRASTFNSDESPSRGSQSSLSHLAPSDHHLQGSRPINGSDLSKNSLRKPIISITEKFMSIKSKSIRLSSHRRHTDTEPVQTLEEVSIWTDSFSLDLPIEISADKSEEDYLRRTQMEEVLEVLKQRLFAKPNSISQIKYEEVVTTTKLTHNTTSSDRSVQTQQMTVRYQQTVKSNESEAYAMRKDSGVTL